MVQQAPYMNTVWNSVPYISDLIGYLVILSAQAVEHKATLWWLLSFVSFLGVIDAII